MTAKPNFDELREKALDMIQKWDTMYGPGWSENSDEIAEIMVLFAVQERKNRISGKE